MTDFSLVLIDARGDAFFAADEREALRGMGETADVIYVRQPAVGYEGVSDPGVIVMGSEEPRLALIRAGVERALCPKVVVLEVSALESFAGAAALARELHQQDERDEDDSEPEVHFVAAQVVDLEGHVLFRSGALALDGTPRITTGRELRSEARIQAPTLFNDPRAFAGYRTQLLASWQGARLPTDESAASELAWRVWLAGGRAVASRTIDVVAREPDVARSARAWKASLGRLLSDETLPRAAGEAKDASALLRAAGLVRPEIDRSLAVRSAVQESRARSDRDLFWEGLLVDAWPAPSEGEEHRRRVAILCSDAVGRSMAGPAIRAIELARVLLMSADVRIAAHRSDDRHPELPCPLHELNDATIDELLEWADALVVQGPLTHWHPAVLRSELPIAVDLYDPMNLEALESVDPDALVPYTTNLLRDQLWRGDWFFCASERQRDFWLGMLAACGRVTPGRYVEDADLEGLIGIVPYGIGAEQPQRLGPGVRAELGIGADDPLFVWNGGIWQWFDPDLLVLAIARLREELPNVRALFMGVRRPGSELTVEAHRLQALIDAHGLRDEHVFVREWTPYAERADTYLDATAVVSLHHAHIETRFSFRTRLLDCIWARTPIICTTGDVLAPVVLEEEIGLTVPAGDLDAIVDALRVLATEPERVAAMREHLGDVSERYRWDVAAEPLVAWSAHPVLRRSERFAVSGLDPVLALGPQLGPPSLGLKALIPLPLRKHVLGPLKRRILQSR